MQDAKEEVRSRLNIEDVVGEYVQLKRSGRNFKGLSPFSGEKTPSFFVSPEKQIWHDFSSNKGGDIFSFVMEVEGLDFRASLEHLARKANVDLSQYQSKGSQEIARRKKRALQACDLAATYYQQNMLKNQHALEYIFKTRGLSKQVVADFRIGYAPSTGDALTQVLRKKGFSRRELEDAGLLNRFGSDLFRGRMTVPLMDGAGQVIGFTGRIIDAGDPNAPKYLNTPQTLLYDKSRHVFGLSQAKEAIRTSAYAVIVEGNLDVVSSHQAGIKQVVATAGTAMTEQHIQALRRLAPTVRLAFDGDKAGVAATERAIPIANQAGIELQVITLPGDAKDPDELIQQDPLLWQQAIDAHHPAVEWVLRQYARQYPVTTAAGKAKFTSAAIAMIKTLHDPVEAEHYIKLAATMAGSSEAALQAKFDHASEDATRELKPVAKTAGTDLPEYDHVDTALGQMLRSRAARQILSELMLGQFRTDEQKKVVQYLYTDPSETNDTPKELQEIDNYVKIILVRAEDRYGRWADADQVLEVARILRRHKFEYENDQYEQKIKQAEADGNDLLASELRTKQYELIKEIKRGER